MMLRQKSLRLCFHADAGEPQSDRALRRLDGIQTGLLRRSQGGLLDMSPGLFDPLTQGRRPGFALTEQDALGIGQPDPCTGTTAINSQKIAQISLIQAGAVD